MFTAVTGVSGSGKSTPGEPGAGGAGARQPRPRAPMTTEDEGEAPTSLDARRPRPAAASPSGLDRRRGSCASTSSPSAARRARTWPPTRACSTTCASCSPATARRAARRYDAGRFSFNVAKGRCETCQGEGFVMVELLFLPSVYAPCPTCHGARYNAKTLEITYREQEHRRRAGHDRRRGLRRSSPSEPRASRASHVLREVGPGLPAPRPAGHRAERRRGPAHQARHRAAAPGRGHTLYVLDEPTTGLHPADVEQLLRASSTAWSTPATRCVVVEHDMRVVAGSDLGD
ncbi:MAG: hypothetical protein WKG07_29930 [Hymenobacter sp.]